MIPSPASTGSPMDRRHFLRQSGRGAFALLAATAGCHHPPALATHPPKIAFNTANLVARFTNYHYELSHWGEQHQRTIAATNEAAWRAMCQEIATAGFNAVEIWEAHAAPEAMDAAKARQWGHILDEYRLQPIGYAGGLRRETLQVCTWLGIPRINGGIGELNPVQATELCRESGISFNFENHPQKNAAEILAKIGGGNDWLGVCIDTGWLGTQGASASEVIQTCGRFVRHTHIKDVRAPGKHETCLLGEGVVNVAGAIATLRQMGYAGWYSWEDEPEDRNPFDSAAQNRRWIEQQLKS